MIRAALVAALLMSACASTKQPTEPARVSPAPAEAASKAASPTPCVQACTDRRRMEAMGWDAIVAECEAECDGGQAP